MRTSLYLIVISLLLSICNACNNSSDKAAYSERRTQMEAEAQKRLKSARVLLAASRCQEAKDTILKMRKDCYLALDARREGILLMDSVDLRMAQLELAETDSLMRVGKDTVVTKADFDEACRKVQFYERKLQFDRKQ